jgi:anti-anti-sigma regulatory factor
VSAFPPLPAELTIYAASELRAQWLAALDASPPEADLQLDASAVTEVDGAGVQLLLALARQLAARDRALRLERPSPRLHEACAALGLDSLLGTAGAAPQGVA